MPMMALIAAIAAVSAMGTAAPITAVKISPNPAYADLPSIRVTFVTAVGAPAGMRYFARYQAFGPVSQMPDGCSSLSQIDEVGVMGGIGKVVAITLRPEPIFGDAFCPGPAHLEIFEQIASPNGRVSPKATARTLRLLLRSTFRIYRAP